MKPPVKNPRTSQTKIPVGYCQCGCGAKTTIAKLTNYKFGRVKGQPTRFLGGHAQTQVRKPSRAVVIDGVKCRTISLTKGMETIVNLADYAKYGKYNYAASLSARTKFYASRRIKTRNGYTRIRLHSEILKVSKGYGVDHINGNGLDNRRCNLRPATHQQGAHNMSKPCTNRSGYKGVSIISRTNQWQVNIKIDRKTKRLGVFPINQLEEAARCYDKGAVKYFGEFANLNFPKPKSGTELRRKLPRKEKSRSR